MKEEVREVIRDLLLAGYVFYVLGYWLIMEDYPPYWWIWALIVAVVYVIIDESEGR